MTFADMFRTALSNLGRRKVRTALTSVGVVVGILTIVTMVSLGVGVQQEIRRQFADLGLENVFVRPRAGDDDFFTQFTTPPRENPITPETIARWREWPNVVQVTPLVDLEGVTTRLELPGGEGLREVQVSGPELFTNPFELPAQALAGELDLTAPEGTIIVNQGALPPDSDPAQLIGREAAIVLQSPRGESTRFPLTIVGVSSSDERQVQVATSDMAAMKSWWFNVPDYLADQGYDAVVLRATNIGEAANLVRTLRAEDLRVQSLELILATANRAFAVINIMLASVGGLALFVACLGIVNTMIMAIYERTREIGTLKAIGASRSDIRGLFMLEAGLIGLIGGVIGIVGGWLLGLGLNQVIRWYLEHEAVPIRADFFVVPWWLVVTALGFAALVGIVAGLYPAARAARLDPLVALRYE